MLSEQTFEPKRLMKVKEAARLLSLSERWLWARIAEGSISVVKLNGATRIALRDLEKYVEASRIPGERRA
jgi:excisionase family DNA binding protein